MAKRNDRLEPVVSPGAMERFGLRMSAIGPYKMSVGDDGVDIEWERPTGLPDLGFRVQVAFATETDSGNLDPDEQMFALWDRVAAGIDRHADHFRRKMVAVYRENQSYFIEQDEFPGDLSDAAIMKLVRSTITVNRHEEDGEVSYWLDASFAARWDGEHAWEFEYDEATDSFGESSR